MPVSASQWVIKDRNRFAVFPLASGLGSAGNTVSTCSNHPCKSILMHSECDFTVSIEHNQLRCHHLNVASPGCSHNKRLVDLFWLGCLLVTSSARWCGAFSYKRLPTGGESALEDGPERRCYLCLCVCVWTYCPAIPTCKHHTPHKAVAAPPWASSGLSRKPCAKYLTRRSLHHCCSKGHIISLFS